MLDANKLEVISEWIRKNSACSLSGVIIQWETDREEREHQEKRIANAGIDTNSAAANHGKDVMKAAEYMAGLFPSCLPSVNPFPTDSNETKLALMCEQHSYVMCSIEIVRKSLLILNAEVSKTSSEAGIRTRDMILILEEVSRHFMTNARSSVKRLSDNIQEEVDEIAHREWIKDKGTSPGLESVAADKICAYCHKPWTLDHICPHVYRAK